MSGNYVTKIKEHLKPDIPRGAVSIVHVYHDSWCAHNNGGVCNCDPDLRLVAPILAKYKQRRRESR